MFVEKNENLENIYLAGGNFLLLNIFSIHYVLVLRMQYYYIHQQADTILLSFFFRCIGIRIFIFLRLTKIFLKLI